MMCVEVASTIPAKLRRVSIVSIDLGQVFGCEKELINEKTYYKRYRICVEHCNMPLLIIDGRRVRFCQQCARFHDISEFEGTKKSCRRKLKLHNQRRRNEYSQRSAPSGKKIKTGSVSPANNNSLEKVDGESSDAGADAETVALLNVRRKSSARRLSCQRREKDTNVCTPLHSFSLAEDKTNTLGASGDDADAEKDSAGKHEIAPTQGQGEIDTVLKSPDGLLSIENPVLDHSASHSLELHMQTVYSHVATNGPLPSGADDDKKDLLIENQTLLKNAADIPGAFSELAHLSSRSVLKSDATRSVGQDSPQQDDQLSATIGQSRAKDASGPARRSSLLEPQVEKIAEKKDANPENDSSSVGRNACSTNTAFIASDNHHSIFDVDQTGARASESKQTAVADLIMDQHVLKDSADMECDLPVGFLDDLPLMPLPCELESMDEKSSALHPVDELTVRWSETMAALQASALPSNVVGRSELQRNDEAMKNMVPVGALHAASMLSFGAAMPPSIGYEPAYAHVRLSMKAFKSTPEQVLKPIRGELGRMVGVSPQFMEGYIRPGCVHFTVDLRVPKHEAEKARKDGITTSLGKVLESNGPLCSTDVTNDMLIQAFGELVVIKRGQIRSSVNIDTSKDVMPCVVAVRPLALPSPGLDRDRTGSMEVLLVGTNLTGTDAVILARQGGRNLSIELSDDYPSTGSFDAIQLGILGLRPGCVEIEVQSGRFLSDARPLLVLPESEIQAMLEIRTLEVRGVMQKGIQERDAFVRDVGFVVQYLDRLNAQEEGRPVPTYTTEILKIIASISCRLIAACVARGWAAMVRLLLPAVQAGGQSCAAAAAIMDAACPEGSTLLHIAVGTGNADIVRLIADWACGLSGSESGGTGDERGVDIGERAIEREVGGPVCAPSSEPVWPVDISGLGGVTPLHVAALLPSPIRREVRGVLSDVYPGVDKLWNLVLTDDHLTPKSLEETVIIEESRQGTLSLKHVPNGPGMGTSYAETHLAEHEKDAQLASDCCSSTGTSKLQGTKQLYKSTSYTAEKMDFEWENGKDVRNEAICIYDDPRLQEFWRKCDREGSSISMQTDLAMPIDRHDRELYSYMKARKYAKQHFKEKYIAEMVQQVESVMALEETKGHHDSQGIMSHPIGYGYGFTPAVDQHIQTDDPQCIPGTANLWRQFCQVVSDVTSFFW